MLRETYARDNDRNKVLDEEFKAMVCDPNILSMILRCYVDEFAGMDVESIKACLDLDKGGSVVRSRNTERPTGMAPIHMDTVFEVRAPDGGSMDLIINLEGQNRRNPGYPIENRMQYYLSELIFSQKGIYFENENYQDMRKAYSIWFMMNPKEEYRNTVLCYTLTGRYSGRSSDSPVPQMALMNIIVINLGGYDDGLEEKNAFSALLLSNGMDDITKVNLIRTKYKIDISSVINRVRKVVSLYEDTKETFLSDGIEIGEKRGIEIGKREAHNSFIEHLLDLAISKAEEKEVPLEEYLETSDYDEPLRNEILEAYRNRNE